MVNAEDRAIDALLDAIEADGARREAFTPAISREGAREVIAALAWLYGARAGSAASIYAAVALAEAVRAVGLKDDETSGD